jgi:hypothetical protein
MCYNTEEAVEATVFYHTSSGSMTSAPVKVCRLPSLQSERMRCDSAAGKLASLAPEGTLRECRVLLTHISSLVQRFQFTSHVLLA